MRLCFKQRMFSWLDSYDIYDEQGNTVYIVKGQFGWGHRLKVLDANGNELGLVQEKIFSWLPRFEIYMNGTFVGSIRKEFSFLKPRFSIDYNGWQVEGDFFGWDYRIYGQSGFEVASVSKQLFQWTDTYVIDVAKPDDALSALMLVIAIDAEKCSQKD